jgi:hypothetical protein
MPKLLKINSWISAIKNYTIEIMLNGQKLNGLKLYEDGKRRKYIDEKKIIELLKIAGFKTEDCTKTTLLPIGELEKKIGKETIKILVNKKLIDFTKTKPKIIETDEPLSPEKEFEYTTS